MMPCASPRPRSRNKQLILHIEKVAVVKIEVAAISDIEFHVEAICTVTTHGHW
jgi:hypothetical protein